MGADDLQLGEVRGHVVQMDGLGELELVAHAARGAGAGAGHAAVEQDRQLQLLAFLPQGVEAGVVGEELLPGRVDLAHAVQPHVLDALDLLQRHLLLPRIDDAEAHEDVGVPLHAVGHVLVGNRGQARDGLVGGVHDHGHHVARAVLVRHLVHGDGLAFPLEVLGHLLRAIALGAEGQLVAKVHVHVNGNRVRNRVHTSSSLGVSRKWRRPSTSLR